MARILPKTFHLVINLCTVYFFEYCIINCFADRIANKLKDDPANADKQDDLNIKEFFQILNLCYQLGVFMSRSSLQYVKIKKVWILTLLQFINWSFLFVNTQFMLVTSLYVMCPLFVWVGLMGGGSYVNVLHSILELKTVKKSEMEGALVMTLMFNDIGIISSAFFTLIMDNSLFKSLKK